MSRTTFGMRIRELRLNAGMTQSQLGEAVGLSKQGINDIEHGRRETNIIRAIAIAKLFNTTVEELWGPLDEPD